MLLNPGQREDPFQKFIDQVKTSAQNAGRNHPDSSDVWSSLLSVSEYASVLSKKGVDTSSLYNEISYITHFKGAEFFEGSYPQYTDEEIREAALELIRELDNTTQLQEMQKEDPQQFERFRRIFTDQLRSALNKQYYKKLDETEKLGDFDDKAYDKISRKLNIRRELQNQAIRDVMDGVLRSIILGSKSMMGGDIKALANPPDAILEQMKQALFLSEEGLDRHEIDYLERLESLSRSPIESPSPVDVVNAVIGMTPPVYESLLLRNGMRVTDPDVTDELEKDLPHGTVQEIMLRALRHAYTVGAKQLTKRHVAMTLLEYPDTDLHLLKVGITDLEKLREKFRKGSQSLDERTKGKIKVHPAIGQDMKDLAVAMDNVARKAVDDDDDEPTVNVPALLHWLIQTDKDIDTCLNKAGLRRKMLAEWPKKYEEKYKPKPKTDLKGKAKGKAKDKTEKDKDKKKEFEVPERELQHLIGQYCVDMTKQARENKFDPVIGHEEIIEKVTTKLLKRGKKNPILVGEAGIGKTAILQGIAQNIVKGKVPRALVGSRLLLLDLHQMNDSPYIGIFESRILPIIKGISERNARGDRPPILLGIDEFGEAVKAGGHAHAPGFQGLIKPYLTTGDIFLIPATTMDEYRTKIEQDPALGRRIQPVYVTEPSTEKTAEILKGLRTKYTTYHKLRIAPALMTYVAEQAGLYMHTVNQPDKSIDLLDEACAIARKKNDTVLTRDHVIQALSDKTNIPTSRLSQSDRSRYVTLEKDLKSRVLGQDSSVEAVAAAVMRAKAGFKQNPNAPMNFLFVGPTGVGKTELAKALSFFLFGNEDDFFVRFDMSEYQESNSVNRLIGSPAGYVNQDEGGLLIKTLRSKPYAVYLYDEVEKAHRDVFNVLLAPFSDGEITDGRGIKGDMRHAINILTSNLGASAVMAEGARLGLDPVKDSAAWAKMARPIQEAHVLSFFKPEFLNRLDGILYFDPLTQEIVNLLVDRCEKTTKAQLMKGYGLNFDLSDSFRKAASQRGFDIRFGARPLKRSWADIVETPLARWLLTQPERTLKAGAKGKTPARLVMTMAEAADPLKSLSEEADIDALIASNPGVPLNRVMEEALAKATPPSKALPPAELKLVRG